MPASVDADIVEPGRYDYDLKVEFPSSYTPEHTPPAFRIAASSPTTRSRYASGQFDLAQPVARVLLRQYFVNQVCEDVQPEIVTVARFDLSPVTA